MGDGDQARWCALQTRAYIIRPCTWASTRWRSAGLRQDDERPADHRQRVVPLAGEDFWQFLLFLGMIA